MIWAQSSSRIHCFRRDGAPLAMKGELGLFLVTLMLWDVPGKETKMQRRYYCTTSSYFPTYAPIVFSGTHRHHLKRNQDQTQISQTRHGNQSHLLLLPRQCNIDIQFFVKVYHMTSICLISFDLPFMCWPTLLSFFAAMVQNRDAECKAAIFPCFLVPW